MFPSSLSHNSHPANQIHHVEKESNKEKIAQSPKAVSLSHTQSLPLLFFFPPKKWKETNATAVSLAYAFSSLFPLLHIVSPLLSTTHLAFSIAQTQPFFFCISPLVCFHFERKKKK
ncbi:hypothetical protein TRIATDRAFT_302266 [Trichoderma atroviride IMI 206040]|uniref:Uncharacterized protein n=1 Tax=Hypocrea atroviridis (strain ATCC 20476 / IMI 206040) TaxID=452589 RepID=G9P478_HYPAI|nr:uncharacterized protein TRIATDRAFT_302266 [Trichoderma atroviride IMI 206040]EHK41922.1 hypothetical protein TRIATDRAFT_302266 [Trichoderma atroviride IMI 206040]